MFSPKTPVQCRPHVYSKSFSRLPKAMAYLSLMAAPCLDDFTILRGLGDGSSGTVYLVRENDTRGLYALKVIQKHKRCRTQLEIETVMAERNALLDLRGNDFILQLRACFHDSRNYYLVTEYHPAGDLHTLLLLKGSPWTVVRFYMAELLLALEHTHAKRIVHRDVKPENVFIDNDGHIVLGDFGLARKLRAKEDTLSIDDMFGTPAYTPPEIFTGKPYSREVDLWAFGVMLYELITGKEAFKSNNVPQDDPTWLAHLARNILRDELETSPYLTPGSTDLIEKLLCKCPKARLCNFDEIKKHQFFFGIDWDLLSNRSLTPPWIPTIGQGNDLGPEYPALTAGKQYSTEDDPIRGFSFRFSPMALTPTCQRHQRFFHSLGGALPTVVNWVEGSNPTLEVCSSSSCTDKGSCDLEDARKYPSFSLNRTPVRRKKLRPLRLTCWARSIFSKCTDASGS